MKFDLSNIKFSRKDVKDSVKIPKDLTPELAEFIGIMVGDGHISNRIRKDRNSGQVYEIQIHGNIKDKKYYSKYVNTIIFNLFNIKFKIHLLQSRNAVLLLRNSKAIHSSLKYYFELPSRKDNIEVPKIIMQSSEEIKTAFLRGFFDADGCFVVKYKPNSYPVVQAASKSSQLINEIAEVLAQVNIPSCTFKDDKYYGKRNKRYITHCINVNGRKRVEKYMNSIGFSNKNKIEKYRKFIENELKGIKKRPANPCKP